MDEIGAEGFDGFSHGRARKGQLQLWIEGQREAGNALNFGSFVLGEATFGAKDADFIAEVLEMFDGVLEASDNSVNFREKGLGEDGNSHGWLVKREKIQGLAALLGP